jgi:hypothetical protein
MSTGIIAAGAAAVAFYVYLKQRLNGDPNGDLDPVLPQEGFRRGDAPPSSWSEAMLHVKEVLG